jgi:peptidoglycan/LPS O-acetylase OafA/YrhL
MTDRSAARLDVRAPGPRTHDPALEGVRGLAVLIVFMSHTSGRGMALAPWLDFQGIGHVGVYLFFVLSGFLLARNLIEGQRAGVYLVRRLFRIVPLYALVVLGTYAWQGTHGFDPNYLHIEGGVAGLIRHLVFIQGDGVFWTIPAEMTFYAVLPVLVWLAVRFGARVLVAIALVYFAWFAAVRFLGAPLPNPRIVAINEHLGQYLDVFLCGVIAAFVADRPVGRIAIPVLVVTLVATLALIADNVLGLGRMLYGARWLSLGYGAAFALVVLATAQGQPHLARLFGLRVLRFMGIAGFGWYLLHMAVFQTINQTLAVPPQVKFAVAFLGCAALSWLAFVLVERPFMALGRSLTTRSRALAAAD